MHCSITISLVSQGLLLYVEEAYVVVLDLPWLARVIRDLLNGKRDAATSDVHVVPADTQLYADHDLLELGQAHGLANDKVS